MVWNDVEFVEKIAYDRDTIIKCCKEYVRKGDDYLYSFLTNLQRDLYQKGQLAKELDIKKALNL
jgi:hypothetical protein